MIPLNTRYISYLPYISCADPIFPSPFSKVCPSRYSPISRTSPLPRMPFLSAASGRAQRRGRPCRWIEWGTQAVPDGCPEAPRSPQVLNPATGKPIATVPHAGAHETRAAIAAAAQAFPGWSRRTGKQRAAVLRKWYEEITRHRDDIAALMTAECGKPLAESRNEIDSGCGPGPCFSTAAGRVMTSLHCMAGRPRSSGSPRRQRGSTGMSWRPCRGTGRWGFYPFFVSGSARGEGATSLLHR